MSAAFSAGADAPSETALASSIAPKRKANGLFIVVLPILSSARSELRAEAVFQRELNAAVVPRVAVEVLALAPEQLGADQDIVGRRVQDVRREVIALLECAAVLAVQVVDLVVAVADRAAPLRVPVVVEVRADAGEVHGLRVGRQRIRRRRR